MDEKNNILEQKNWACILIAPSSSIATIQKSSLHQLRIITGRKTFFSDRNGDDAAIASPDRGISTR
jgi:hypothetical protein